MLIKVRHGTSEAGVEGMLQAFNALPEQIDSSILVQLTAGQIVLHSAYPLELSGQLLQT